SEVKGATQPITIAYLLNQFEDGGAERQLIELIKRLDPVRFRPLLYLGSSSGCIARELDGLNIPIRYVRGKRGGKYAALKLAREFRRERPKIVHSWMFVANTWARIAGTLARVPIVITSDRGMDTEVSRLHRIADMLLSPGSDHVIVNAHAVAQNVHDTRYVSRDKITNVYNGVDLDLYGRPMDRKLAKRALDLPLDVPVIGMVASFCARKRWDVFLEAVEKVNAGHAVTAICVGDGELRGQMEEYARALGIEQQVRFLGVRADVPNMMAAMDVFVLSSDDEGMPNVVMQAMAAGLPVVATDAGGTDEIVSTGKTGFLVDRGDSETLAQKICTLLEQPELMAEFGRAGRQLVERDFTFTKSVKRMVELYDREIKKYDNRYPRLVRV
ncbi:MAG: glycosyltransferase, partial [Chloroflexota bacterium]